MVEWRFKDELFPLVVAHRGASVTYPENTLDAFEAALAAGAQAVELDVRLTADGVPVILHDADVSRTTGGRGLVSELTLAELKALRAGPPGNARAEVPTLEEVLTLASGRGGLDVEIKNLPGEPGFDALDRVVELTIDLLRRRFLGPALICSFNPSSLGRARELAPEIPTGLLSPDSVDARAALRFVVEVGHLFALPSLRALAVEGERLVAEAHVMGVRVGTWTVDEPRTVRDLFDWGVDAVATNDPEMAVAVRAEWLASRP